MARQRPDREPPPQQKFSWRAIDEAPEQRDIERWPILFDIPGTRIYFNQMSQVLWMHDIDNDTWQVTSLLQLG